MSAKLSHYLTIYDGQSEQCIEAIKIAKFPLDKFKEQFDVLEQDDPQMIDRYSVSSLDTDFLSDYIDKTIDYDFTQFGYFIEALKP